MVVEGAGGQQSSRLTSTGQANALLLVEPGGLSVIMTSFEDTAACVTKACDTAGVASSRYRLVEESYMPAAYVVASPSGSVAPVAAVTFAHHESWMSTNGGSPAVGITTPDERFTASGLSSQGGEGGRGGEGRREGGDAVRAPRMSAARSPRGRPPIVSAAAVASKVAKPRGRLRVCDRLEIRGHFRVLCLGGLHKVLSFHPWHLSTGHISIAFCHPALATDASFKMT